MRSMKICLCFIICLGLLSVSVPKSYADETSEAILKLLIKKGILSEGEVRNLKAEAARGKPAVPKALEDRVAVLEEKAEDKGFLSFKGVEFQLGGELEYEFVDTAGDGEEDEAHFQLDKMVLQPKIKIGDKLKLDAQIYFVKNSSADRAYIEEFHAEFTDLFLNSWADVGLYERWVKGQYKRKLEAYPLVGTAFWRDDAPTLTWGGEHESIYWMFSVGNGYELDRKQVSEDTANNNDILHDNRAGSGVSDSMEYGINIGLKQELFGGNIDILGFYYYDELSSDDRTFLQAQFPGYTSSADDKNRLGVSVRYDLNDWRFAGQYIKAEDGELDRDGWVIEAGYHLDFQGREWLTGVMPIISYGEMDIDNSYDRNLNNPLSWDRQKTMVGLIFDLYKNTKLRLEYYVNDEDTGGDDIDNNEFLAQLEIKF